MLPEICSMFGELKKKDAGGGEKKEKETVPLQNLYNIKFCKYMPFLQNYGIAVFFLKGIMENLQKKNEKKEEK